MSPPAGASARARRIGLFGGTFDPVHNAHVALAKLALEQLRLDEVWWIPTGEPWQKRWKPAPAHHRAAMVELAIAGEPRFHLERIEIERSGPSYTLDTVRELAALHPHSEWFLILGQDQYANLHTWRGWEELLGRVTLAVAGRAGQDPSVSPHLASVPHRVEALPLPAMPESSTELRRALLEQGPSAEGVDRMVPAEVARYIELHRLYTRNA